MYMYITQLLYTRVLSGQFLDCLFWYVADPIAREVNE
jgi:hypothetical protein